VIDLDRVTDVELLRTVAKVQDGEIRRLHVKISALVTELATANKVDAKTIQERLAILDRELREAYEKTRSGGSERRPRSDDKPRDPKPDRREPVKGHGPTAQPALPIVPVDHKLDEADLPCPRCGQQLEEWKGKTEDSEEVDVVEVKYVIKQHRRQKYRCRCGDCIETAPGPLKLIKGGRYSLGFAVHSAMDKYSWHIPLERQATRMSRSGLQIESQTLWDQIYALSLCFEAARERLHQYLLSKPVLMGDETRWPLLGVKGRATTNWFDWVLVADDAVLHSILDSRSNDAADEVLTGFKGTLLTDAYGVYGSRAKALGFMQAYDWCHARRRVIEAEATAPNEANPILDDIAMLFLIEREIVEEFTGRSREDALALRHRARQSRSKPVVERIGSRAYEVKALPSSPIAQAVKYLENQWFGLIRFLDDPQVPITSNMAEASLRGLVLGRNNHFGSRSQRGTEVAAIFYTFIESARMNGLDPGAYLTAAATAHLRGQKVPLPHELRGISLGRPIAAPSQGPAPQLPSGV
jgi:transposase